MVSKYDYSVTPGDRLGRPLAKELAALFSSAYGKWSRKSPVNPGGRIRLGADYYLKNYGNGLFRIATCRAGTRLIAQAVYLERDTPRGRVSLVVQPVHRRGARSGDVPALQCRTHLAPRGICRARGARKSSFSRKRAVAHGRIVECRRLEVLHGQVGQACRAQARGA